MATVLPRLGKCATRIRISSFNSSIHRRKSTVVASRRNDPYETTTRRRKSPNKRQAERSYDRPARDTSRSKDWFPSAQCRASKRDPSNDLDFSECRDCAHVLNTSSKLLDQLDGRTAVAALGRLASLLPSAGPQGDLGSDTRFHDLCSCVEGQLASLDGDDLFALLTAAERLPALPVTLLSRLPLALQGVVESLNPRQIGR